MKTIVAILFLLFWTIFVQSQIVITPNSNAQQLANSMAGNGVFLSNFTLRCDPLGSGTFTSAGTNLGLARGIVLASGKVTDIPNPANLFATYQFKDSGETSLAPLAKNIVYDPCVLEFDIIPDGNLLSFNYVFASEEYPEFVCSPYNDVFGFFISGGIYANTNIALIPFTALPVSINSVNGGTSGTYMGTTWNPANCASLTNTAYYVDNLNPVNPFIVYDGMTVVLTASAQVVPCTTYHFKIAIADVGDRIYDSGVLIKQGSFISRAPCSCTNPLTVTIS